MTTRPAEWRLLKAGDVLLGTQYGLNLPSSDEGNLPIVGMKDLNGGLVHDNDLARVQMSEKDAEPFLLRRGDLLLNRTNSPDLVGKIGYVAEPIKAVFASYLVRLVPDPAIINSKFLAYWLTSSRGQEEIKPLITRGVSQANINPTTFCKHVRIPVPPIGEQKRIAEILNTWDRAIEAARGLRDFVEQQFLGIAAQKIPLRGNDMRPLRTLLSPDRMQEVEPDGAFRALGIRSHGRGTFQRTDDLAALGSTKTLYRVEPDRFVVNIVFAWEGAAAITSEEDAGCLVSHRFPTFTINETLLHRDYFRYMIRTKPFQQLLVLASPGGAGRNKTLNRGDLLRFEVHVPPLKRQGSVAAALSTLDQRVRLLDRYLECLTSQRDALAGELLTGQRRVRHTAEASVAG